jgi:hypothetical protein
MKLKRFLLYGLAASLTSTCLGLYVLAAVLYAIPMISGLLDDSMEVKFDRPNAAIVADYVNGLTPRRGELLPCLARLRDHALDPLDRGRCQRP